MERYIFVFLLYFLFHIHAVAQQEGKDSVLNRTIIVENEYNPAIMDAAKINTLPKVEEPAVTKKDIQYSRKVFPVTDFPIYAPLPSLASLPIEGSMAKGYFRAGYGNYGNIDMKGNYLFDFTVTDRLNLYASLNGLNGKLSFPSGFLPEVGEDWKARYYRTQAGADYLHRFGKADLNMAAHFESDVFSYLPSAGKQHYTKGQIHAKVLSESSSLPLQFSIETDYLYFGKKYHEQAQDSDKEHIFRARADVSGSISGTDKIGLRITMDNLFYTQAHRTNYTVLDWNPYYISGNDTWKFRLGAHADFSFGKGKAFQAAPDIDVQYIFADSYVLYFTAAGGRQINDYRRLQQMAPLGAPDKNIYLPSIKNTYIPLDGSVGLKASPLNGFWFNVFGGYRFIDNDLCLANPQGNGWFSGFASYVPADTKVAYIGAELKYRYKECINFYVKGNYYHWQADEDYLLISKPEMSLETGLDMQIWTGFNLNVGYQYLRRTAITHTGEADKSGTYHYLDKGTSYRMKDIHNLFFGGSYHLLKGMRIFVKLDNMLNQNYQYDYSYPTEKFNFLAGLSMTF